MVTFSFNDYEIPRGAQILVQIMLIFIYFTVLIIIRCFHIEDE